MWAEGGERPLPPLGKQESGKKGSCQRRSHNHAAAGLGRRRNIKGGNRHPKPSSAAATTEDCALVVFHPDCTVILLHHRRFLSPLPLDAFLQSGAVFGSSPSSLSPHTQTLVAAPFSWRCCPLVCLRGREAGKGAADLAVSRGVLAVAAAAYCKAVPGHRRCFRCCCSYRCCWQFRLVSRAALPPSPPASAVCLRLTTLSPAAAAAVVPSPPPPASSSSVRSGVRFSSGGAGSGGSKQRRREGEGTEGQGGGSGGAEAGRPLISDGNGSGGGRGATWQIHSAPPLQLAYERLGTRLTAGGERKGARPSHPHPCDMPGLWSDGTRYSAPPRARAAAS